MKVVEAYRAIAAHRIASTTALQADNERLAADNARLRDALGKIASCESHIKGDVVSIARQALGDTHE
jgi:hypothetical protein